MPATTAEATFEAHIADTLASRHGFRRVAQDGYDRTLCLRPETVISFIRATQGQAWTDFCQLVGGVERAQAQLLARVAACVAQDGVATVLRKGVRIHGDRGTPFRLCYFAPANPVAAAEVRRLHAENVFEVQQQLKYAPQTEHALDLALFVNGLPIFTAELKNELSGQRVAHALHQYRHDRDPKQALFQSGRCLAHFAVDSREAQFTTRLRGRDTTFLPFNRGYDGGAGNPPARTRYATAYLWEEVWAPDSILDLVQRFVRTVEEYGPDGRQVGEPRVRFPRYHQLTCVRDLTRAAQADGAGHRYLNQHSAGSGKTACIAWLASSLATLHDANGRTVFDSVVVVSDRRVIDRQLQREISQVIDTPGVVRVIDGDAGATAADLRQALQDGKQVIVTTLQKFGVIQHAMGELAGTRFAVIVDEAHSSQAGEAGRAILRTLGQPDVAPDDDDLTYEDVIAALVRARGPQPNLSYFAFTATPKPQTLELFGTRGANDQAGPFSLYTMRQAIEEGFILDVLVNYTTYDQRWKLLKTAEEDPRFDQRAASKLLTRFAVQHEVSVARKVEVIVDHFLAHVASHLGGEAKAMIVTASRLQAVRYRQALDACLARRAPVMQALVAFTGTVEDPATGEEFTEPRMNRRGTRVIGEHQTADEFRRPEYRFLVVASKFQTGFDQPQLVAMYVDRTLQGVTAVQTLSRLNRTAPGKDTTFVLDFANAPEAIAKSFQRFYDRVRLDGETDPNTLYDLLGHLEGYGLCDGAVIEQFAKVWFAPGAHGTRERQGKTIARCQGVLDGAVAVWQQLDEDQREDARSKARDFVRLYSFLSQVVPFNDTSVERRAAFLDLLVRKLPPTPHELPREIFDLVDIGSFAVRVGHEGAIALAPGSETVTPVPFGADIGAARDPEYEVLSAILQDLNEQFGTAFTADEIEVLKRVEEAVAADPALQVQLRNASQDAQRATFEKVAKDALQVDIDRNFRFYQKVTDDHRFSKVLFDRLFGWFRGRPRKGAA